MRTTPDACSPPICPPPPDRPALAAAAYLRLSHALGRPPSGPELARETGRMRRHVYVDVFAARRRGLLPEDARLNQGACVLSEATPRQEEVLGHIRRLTRERGYPPTLRELTGALGISSLNGIQCHLTALKRRGLLRVTSGKARSLIPVAEGAPSVRAHGGRVRLDVPGLPLDLTAGQARRLAADLLAAAGAAS